MISVRILAVSLVLIATIGMARMAGSPYRNRLQVLEEWQRLLRHLEPLMEWKLVPLGPALREAVRGQRILEPPILILIEDLQHPDAVLEDLWGTLLASLPELFEDDVIVLSDFGRSLGKSEPHDEKSQLQSVAHELERLISEARYQKSHDGRVFPALVTALGMAVVILMV